ncbi:MAG: LysR family transcriptional regulator [Kofleriaceae bacterium]|nr:LysR family transcriptional regulator [Kofleriaceae bacterium]
MDRIEALRLFARIAEHQSFSSAAVDLKIKQSTASKWLAALEADLGVRLVERTTRSVRLTEAGRRFLDHSSEVVARFDEARRELSEGRTELADPVRLNLPVVFGRLFVVPEVASFLRLHPKVRADIVLADRYVNLVEEGFDLAVRVGVPTDTSTRGVKVATSRRCLVASPEYLEVHGRPTVPRDLRRHECLVHGAPSAPSMWRFTRSGRAARPVLARGRIAADNSETVLELARAGLGIGLLADWLVASELRTGALVLLMEAYEAPPAPVYILTPGGRRATPTVRALVEHLAAGVDGRLRARASERVEQPPRHPRRRKRPLART